MAFAYRSDCESDAPEIAAALSKMSAYSLMHREHRRYFRMPLDMPVVICFNQGQEAKATACNLSEGGMAIRAAIPLPRAGVLRVRFTLPETSITLEPKAEMTWSDGAGCAGIRFLELPSNSTEQLERWIFKQVEQRNPVQLGLLQASSTSK